MFNHFGAKNEIRRLFLTRFRDYVKNGIPNQTPSIGPLNLTRLHKDEIYIPTIFWRNVEQRRTNDNSEHWLHFSMRNVTTVQKTFAGGRVQEVGTTYTTNGFTTVEVYFSKSAYQSDDEDKFSTIIQRCFLQINTGSIWFRNPVIVDLDPEENHFRSNILAEYEYDSIIT